MASQGERRVDRLSRLLKARTRHDGTPRVGYEQNVAHLRAEIELLTAREEGIE